MIYQGVGGEAEASIWQVGGNDTWAEGGYRARQAGESWTCRIKNVVFCGPMSSFSGLLESPQLCLNCNIGE